MTTQEQKILDDIKNKKLIKLLKNDPKILDVIKDLFNGEHLRVLINNIKIKNEIKM